MNYKDWNSRIRTLLKGVRQILLVFGMLGMILIQGFGFRVLIDVISKISKAGFLDKILGCLVLIGTPLAYYYFFKEVLEGGREKT